MGLTVIFLIVVLQAIAYKEKVTKISSKYHMISIDIALLPKKLGFTFGLCVRMVSVFFKAPKS